MSSIFSFNLRGKNIHLWHARGLFEINYITQKKKQQRKKKRRASWFSRYFEQSSRPSKGGLMKIRKVVTKCCKTVTVRYVMELFGI